MDIADSEGGADDCGEAARGGDGDGATGGGSGGGDEATGGGGGGEAVGGGSGEVPKRLATGNALSSDCATEANPNESE
jgi:hypothetical protein